MTISRNNGSDGLGISDLCYSYDGLLVLDQINFSVAPGEGLGIVGPSGCGKSTLLHIIAGLLDIDRGSITFQGREVHSQPGWISYMQQDDLLLPWMTVEQNIALPLKIQGRDDASARQAVLPALDEFGLEGFGGYLPEQLSGGMRQRAAFMRACMFRQDFLLLDEPFSRLDYMTRRHMHNWFRSYLAEHKPGYILVTHDPEEAMTLCHRVVVMSSRPARIVDDVYIGNPVERTPGFATSSEAYELKERILAKAQSLT